MEMTHDWTYDDGDIDTHGTVVGNSRNDCAERVLTVLQNAHDDSISEDNLTIEGF